MVMLFNHLMLEKYMYNTLDKKKEHRFLVILPRQQENIMSVIVLEIHKDHHMMQTYGYHQQTTISNKDSLV